MSNNISKEEHANIAVIYLCIYAALFFILSALGVCFVIIDGDIGLLLKCFISVVSFIWGSIVMRNAMLSNPVEPSE